MLINFENFTCQNLVALEKLLETVNRNVGEIVKNSKIDH